MLDADRSPNAVHAGTSQVDFEVDCPPPACLSTTRSLDHHGKGNGNFVYYKKRVPKNEKKVVSLIDLKEMKTRNDCEIARDCDNMVSVTDLSQKESFPGSEFKPASIWTCWMQIDRQMQSAFMPELHRWISKLTARHLEGPPGDLLITMVRETVILYKKRVSKNEKKSYLSLI